MKALGGLFAAGAAALAVWLEQQGAPSGGLLALEPTIPQYGQALGAGVLLGALAFWLSGRGWARGAGWGLLCGWLGVYAWLWRLAAEAWRHLGWFAGPLAIHLLPVVLVFSLGALAWALLDEDARPAAPWIIAMTLALWLAPAHVAHWRLSLRGHGPRSLLQASAAAPEAEAEQVSVAWLKPSGADAPYKLETRTLAEGGVSADPRSLDRLYAYLEGTRYGGVFSRAALSSLRKGWLLRWEPERALTAGMLSFRGRVSPDYRTALGLLRAGPLVPERFARLRALADLAAESSAGFEDVNQSQYIFEGFSAAFARFGDEEDARNWILRVDNLWPIYEKKVEVAPLEYFRDGEIAGSVEADGAPAQGVRVGLFYVAESSSSLEAPGLLSQAADVDFAGRFRFANLGAGVYYLGLMGSTATVAGRVENSPSFIEVSPETPFIALPAVKLARTNVTIP